MKNKGIDYFGYNNPLIRFKTFFSLRAREKMYNMFDREFRPNKDDLVLDLGGTPDDTLADSNFFEKMYPYKENITMSSIEDCENIVKEYGLKGFVQNKPYEALPFAKKSFDILFCSAVLEHVGDREQQTFFISECNRVAKKVFLTTPYRYFPIEMHTFVPFLHFLPWSIFQRIISHTKRGAFWADIHNLNLVSKKDMEQMTVGMNKEIKFIHTIGLRSNIVLMIKS